MKGNGTYSYLEPLISEVEHIFVIDDFASRIESGLFHKESLFSSEFGNIHPSDPKLTMIFQMEVKFDRFELYDVNGKLLQINCPFIAVRLHAKGLKQDRSVEFQPKGKCQFTILDDFEHPIKESEDNQMHSSGVRSWYVEKFLCLDDPRTYLCESGALVLRSHLTLNLGDRIPKRSYKREDQSLDVSKALSQRLSRESYPDIYLVSQGLRFPCHKHMLASCSEVFEAMFSQENSSEAISNEVKIEDIDPDTLEKVLDFVYKDKVVDFEGLAINLIYAAEKYNLENLKILAVQRAVQQINVMNVSEVLILGDRVQSNTLKEAAMDFILRNIQSVRSSAGWKELTQNFGNLVDEVLGELL
ncbi:hypothetical protein TCAL_09496 [Tigriopus californicus]|uniref:BTB domain-containing protein n=1 Tax=Tigriopus californicus TaxID=6832 RepID=A0A553PC42_TIGCA|nr:speckle-type POZ protein B-like [Tigriopus californicus]TRY75243.1 hypothetical protein TCAL_09496 [Tigriopus californicus]|eukprot:TCALIF_09496-PA protein Name:"Similar to spop-b Speckle-type POZ protein B (Xenopus laevis)" AED:0.04 eAED:0.04 QI:0/-1/0/1/-1/1/1/0/357